MQHNAAEDILRTAFDSVSISGIWRRLEACDSYADPVLKWAVSIL